MAFLWRIDGQRLQVKLAAKTKGWLGVGFGPEPGQAMKGVNLIVGSVKNGKAEIEDHYETMKTAHKPDEKPGGKTDISEANGSENEEVSELSSVMPLDSSDTNDKAIKPAQDTIVP